MQLRLRRVMAQLADSSGLDDDAFDAKMDELDRLVEDAERAIALILVSVPRAWLVDNAPESLDWSDVASLAWVRSDKMDVLREAAVEARAPENVTGK
ncbi:MAG: hypothetical protein LC121_13465 [Anaerolineae bacterium]|nr:hypothetical protein [Anaerolineae bacterium]